MEVENKKEVIALEKIRLKQAWFLRGKKVENLAEYLRIHVQTYRKHEEIHFTYLHRSYVYWLRTTA